MYSDSFFFLKLMKGNRQYQRALGTINILILLHNTCTQSIILVFRLKDFLADLVHEKSPCNENVLIVSHKGTIRALVCLLLENSSYYAHNVQSTNCPIGYNCVSHFELEISDKTIQNCKVFKLFDCSHLI